MKKILMVAGLAIVTACSTVSQMTPTGGSRSDGIVELSFEYGMFDKVKLDQETGLQQARQRCQTWGYTDAEAFGGVVRQCQAMGGYGCARWFATMKYQCTGANVPS